MSITAIAMGLAHVVPDIVGWIAGDEKEQVARDVVNIAKRVTGKDEDTALETMQQNPELAHQFKMAVLANKHKYEEMVLADRKNAREAYKVNHEASDSIAMHIMKWNLPLVFALVVIDVLACIYLKDHAALLTTVSTLVGVVINSLLKERQDVTGFHFGSSLGSKLKTEAGIRKSQAKLGSS